MYKYQKYLLIITFFMYLILSACNEYIPPTSSTSVPILVSDMSNTVGQIVYEGKITLYADVEAKDNPNAFLNLRTGPVSDSSLGNIEFVVSRGGGGAYFYFLQPINGSKANRIGGDKLEPKECLDAIPVLTEGNIPGIKIDDYICAVTDDGYLARMAIQDIDMSKISKGWVEIAVTTWEIP